MCTVVDTVLWVHTVHSCSDCVHCVHCVRVIQLTELQFNSARYMKDFRALGYDFDDLVEKFTAMLESLSGRSRWFRRARLWRLIFLQARARGCARGAPCSACVDQCAGSCCTVGT